MIKTLVLVGLGGGMGSMFRYLISVSVNKFNITLFPWATFLVNILGCLLIGVIIGLFDRQLLSNPNLKFLFITGFCGGFTTFSAFASENISLFNSGNTFIALLYILVSVVGGLFAIWLGLLFTRGYL